DADDQRRRLPGLLGGQAAEAVSGDGRERCGETTGGETDGEDAVHGETSWHLLTRGTSQKIWRLLSALRQDLPGPGERTRRDCRQRGPNASGYAGGAWHAHCNARA